MESLTIASVIELLGNDTLPLTAKLVDVALVEVKFVTAPVVATSEVTNKFVDVAFVNTPAAGVTRPIDDPLIGLLPIVPPLIVRPSTTYASVIESTGRLRRPVTARFVVVALVPLKLTNVSP